MEYVGVVPETGQVESVDWGVASHGQAMLVDVRRRNGACTHRHAELALSDLAPHTPATCVLVEHHHPRLPSVTSTLDRLIPYADWLERLPASAPSSQDEEAIKANPGVQLLPFYTHGEKASGQKEAILGLRAMDMRRAMEIAPSLGEGLLEKLGTGEEDVKGWIEYWRAGFLSG